jgi:hypothetical protein
MIKEIEMPKTAETTGPKYPQVKVTLVGEDGNAFSILGRVSKAMRRAGISQEEIQAFMTEAMSGDYDHLLQTVIKTVDAD